MDCVMAGTVKLLPVTGPKLRAVAPRKCKPGTASMACGWQRHPVWRPRGNRKRSEAASPANGIPQLRPKQMVSSPNLK
jgi:hypothetical protein